MLIKRYAHHLVLAVSILWAGSFFALQVADHFALRTQLNDLGHMEQALWSAAQGDLRMTVTHPGPGAQSRLHEHANLIFYFLAPLYVVFPTPLFLLTLSPIAFGVGGYFLFLLTRHVTGSALVGLGMSMIFFAHPMLHDAVLFDFHPVVLSTALIPLILFLAETSRWKWFWVALAALLFLKEDMPLLVLSLSPFMMVRYGRAKGLITAAVAASYWFFLRLGLPLLIGSPVAVGNWDRLGMLGASPEEVIVTILLNPLLLVEVIDTPTKLSYLTVLLFQGGYFFALAPLLALAAAPNVIQNVVVNTDWQAQVTGVYYAAAPVTVLLGAVMYGYAQLRSEYPRLASGLLFLFVLQIAVQSIILTPLPYGLLSHREDYGQYSNRETFRRLKGLIPPTASVAVQNNLGAHVAGRAELYGVRDYARWQPDYVFIHMQDPTWRFHRLFFERQANRLVSHSAAVFDDLFADERYGLVDFGEAFYLFERGESREKNAEGLIAARQDFAAYRRRMRHRPVLPTYEQRLENLVLRLVN